MRYGKSKAHSMGMEKPAAAKIRELGEQVVAEKYGNLFEIYEKIMGVDPYKTPMMIYPAVHYTMGGLWVDYNLETNIPGLFATGECNFSDHGANRLGASALMQGLADGYFVLPYTIGAFLSGEIRTPQFTTDTPEFEAAERDVRARIEQLFAVKGKKSAESFHRRLGKIMWDYCGMARNAEGLKSARQMVGELRDEFFNDLNLPGVNEEYNPELEKALRLADYMELGELMILDALNRNESCGGHFREEYETEDGEALRDDEHYAYVAAWEYPGPNQEPVLHKEELVFDNVELKTRSYK